METMERTSARDPIMSTLGFNLIVRNEENCLERTLGNIRPIADEIVVTDTGSEDDTVAIADRFADKVLFHAWQDSFSEARNWGLRHSSTDWVCWIDADEWIENPGRIQELLTERPDAMALFCAMNNEMPGGLVARHYLPKFFRNGTAHFEGIVHNQLIHQRPIYPTDITFRHSGYNESPEIMAKKQARTIRLLRKQLEGTPENTFALMNLGRSLFNAGDLEECLMIVDRGLSIETGPTHLRQLLLYQRALIQLNDGDVKVFQTIHECLSINIHNLDMLFLKAEAALQHKRYVDALMALRAYRAEKDFQQSTGYCDGLLLDYWDIGILEEKMLASAYLGIKHYPEARKGLRKVLTVEGYEAEHWRDYIFCLEQIGDVRSVNAAKNEAIARGVLIYAV